jgi:hypothetical protein
VSLSSAGCRQRHTAAERQTAAEQNKAAQTEQQQQSRAAERETEEVDDVTIYIG